MGVVRVLGVDDDPNILEVMRLLFLGNDQVKLVSYNNPLKALKHLETQPDDEEYALAFVDIKMPGMTGIEFMAHLRNLSPRTVRINMSSHADLQLVLEALGSNHIFDFIRKPLIKEDFLATYNKALEYYELRIERDHLAQKLVEKNALLEQWNHCLDAEVQRKTFELKLRDNLMQHLSGCLYLDDPFVVVQEFAQATVPGFDSAIYSYDQEKWSLVSQNQHACLPEHFYMPDIENARCGVLNSTELAHLQHAMKLTQPILWAEILLYRGGVVGLWCLTAKEPKEVVPLKELSQFAPLVGLLIYDELIMSSLAGTNSPLFNCDDLE